MLHTMSSKRTLTVVYELEFYRTDDGFDRRPHPYELALGNCIFFEHFVFTFFEDREIIGKS